MIIKTQISISPNDLRGMVLLDNDFEGRRPCILVIHGWTGKMASYERRVIDLLKMGYMVLLFDMRGHGETGGNLSDFTIKDHLEDVIAAFDYMTNLKIIDRFNVSVLGASYGGYLASILSSKRNIDRLGLIVPALYPDDMVDVSRIGRDELINEFRKVSHDEKDNKALAAIAKFNGDLLIIEAENDERIPHLTIEDYIKSYKNECEHRIIKGANHDLKTPGANEERIKILNEWFKKYI